MLKFDIEKRDGLARVGVIHTPHGDIKTPAFVGAATRATVKALTMKEMNELGSQAILANTYHLILRPGVELIQEAGGLAEFCSWHKPTFTDSGGFQIFSLPNVKITEESVKFKSHIDGANFEITPESSMQAQWAIGADIHMAFDHLAKSEDKKDMKEAMHRTHRWLDRCVAEHQRIKSMNAMDGEFEAVRDDGSGIASEPRNDYSSFSKDTIIDWNIKSLMHNNKDIAEKILSGAKFWDLGQAAFLLNPLAREEPRLSVPEEEYQNQLKEFEQYPRLYNIYTDFDLPLIPILYQMEEEGMLIDRDYFKKLQIEFTAEVQKLENEICELAGTNFNVNSPIQLSEVLFTKLQLPTKGIKKTTRGYSTGAKELDKLKDFHPIISKIIEYREAAKLLNTYIIPIPNLADPSGRIHTTFTQNVTATGRLSSKDPNLQNIPVRTDAGKRIRTGFIASQGKVLVSADYSQFELRLAAILSGDQALIDDFNHDVDIHTKTASEAFNVPMNEVTKEQRRAAKVINFGILYGMSVKGLSDAAKMPIREAKAFIDNYFNLRAPIKQKLDDILRQAKEEGFVETYYGRRRPTPDVKSPNFVIREAAKRAAENMPIQGTEADLMKRAMIKVSDKLPEGANLIMQVHDSLIVECDIS